MSHWWIWMIKGFVWLKKRSLITHHLIFVIHYSSLKIPKLLTLHPFGTITQLVITQNFQLFVSPITVTWCSFYLFFFLQPPMPKLTELSVKKKNQWKGKEKKKKKKKPPSVKGKRKKRRWRNQTHQTQWRKKKEGQKLRLTLTVGPSM